jgi:2-amino-4-hydroxy-6-hydroxymethyldihydropteridine diphosphokinase
MIDVYLIVGSNINPESNIRLALEYLCAVPGINIIRISSIWKTRPVGTRSDDFLNLAIHLESTMNEVELKELILCEIEEKMGRIRVEDKFAPRPIDLDIVIFDGQILDQNLFKHDYLILPFSELLPQLESPTHGITLKVLAATIKPFSTAQTVPIPKIPLS